MLSRLARWVFVGIILFTFTGCRRGDVLVAEEQDIQLSFDQLKSTYKWDGKIAFYEWERTAKGVSMECLDDGARKLFGKAGIGNLKFDGPVIVNRNGDMTLEKGSRMYYNCPEQPKWLRWPFLLRWLLPILIILVLIGTGYYYAPVLRRRIIGSASDAGNGRCYCSLAILQAGASWTYRSAACWARRMASRISTVVKAGIDRHTEKVRRTWARQSITADDIRQSVSRTVRGGLTIAGLLGLQGLLLISLKTNDYSFKTYDWLALIIKAIITGIGISLYKPIVLLVSSHVAAFVRSGRKPGWQPYCGNFVAVARNLTLLALFGMCGLILVPKLARFNAQVLHVEWMTTGLHVGVVLAAVGILFLVWLHAYPLVDLLSGAITGKIAPSPGSAMPPPVMALHCCPNCQTENDSDSLFCCSCGTSLPQPTKKPDPPVERQCPNCASPNDVESKFCFNCGKPL